MRALTLSGGIVLAACLAVGCSDRTRQDAREAGQEAGEAARAAGQTAQSAAQDAVNTAERAGDAAVNASRDASRQGEGVIEETGQAAGAAVQTAKVKAALVADSKVQASGIDVDTSAETRTITLKGHVPSATQKAAAERIAVEKASPGYTVRNELRVSGS
jgi:osmotically-inducible protein OsmY